MNDGGEQITLLDKYKEVLIICSVYFLGTLLVYISDFTLIFVDMIPLSVTHTVLTVLFNITLVIGLAFTGIGLGLSFTFKFYDPEESE